MKKYYLVKVKKREDKSLSSSYVSLFKKEVSEATGNAIQSIASCLNKPSILGKRKLQSEKQAGAQKFLQDQFGFQSRGN